MFVRKSVAAAVAAVFGICVATNGFASIILQYQTASSGTNPTLSPDIEAANVTGDNMAAGSGIASASGGTWNWNSWDDPNGNSTNSFATAVALDNTWTWGFDVDSGSITGSLLRMDIRVDRSGTGPNQFEIQASVNAGTPVSILTFDFGDSASGVDFEEVDLSGLGNLSSGDSVDFTLAAFGEDSGGFSQFGTFDLETVDFGGSDPRSLRIFIIPEPATFALMGFGLAGMALRRRN